MFGRPKTAKLNILHIVILSALLLITSRSASAQTETAIHAFEGCGGGCNSFAPLISDRAGNFYGTTKNGGAHSAGVVFKLTPISIGGWKETVLYSFCSAGSCTDGEYPLFAQLMFDSKGNLYGTTSEGGAYGQGTVYELSPEGPRWTETVLYSFCSDGWPNCRDGASPVSGLVMDAMGNLYGTTQYGGAQKTGTVFELRPSGTERVIASINSWGAGLTMDAAGNIFGAEISRLFELSPNGKGDWNLTVLHSFTPLTGDLQHIYITGTPTLDSAGNLYGTTNDGGDYGSGSVYKLSSEEKGRWTYTLLYSFDGQDGSGPVAGIVLDSAGNIYGTTNEGGQFNAGTVFELTPQVGNSSYRENTLWNFNTTDGALPYGTLILDRFGNLYGTTEYGGYQGDGVVFEVTPQTEVQ